MISLFNSYDTESIMTEMIRKLLNLVNGTEWTQLIPNFKLIVVNFIQTIIKY